MLNRRHIRTKVIQSIYSNSVELLDHSTLKTYITKSSTTTLDLLYCMIDFIKEINIHFNNIESKKFSCSFVSQNPYFFFFNKLNQKSFNRKHIINWDLHLNYIMDLQSDFIELNKKFLELNKDDDESKLSFFIESYSGIIAESNMLYEFLEDQNINWVNDFPYVNSFILKNIEKIDIQNTNSFHLPSLFDYQDELEFGQDLFNNILTNNEELKNHLIGRTPNWDSERIAKIDYAILLTSIAELLYFPSIPPKVTINEYIEIAKEFSSPSSGKFINGVIDKLIKDLTEKGLIVKTGRGLIS
ncbi:transcription antitermination factor NusB [Flavobacteriaceae bacterium]|nr:transcription antitermination factor NusB [Flavobacteriaceae bacterium]MDB3873980.1 transcription antitermination factor NusB [Flavobacteriaceae bacterium]MDC0984672.1 transcription antitermination factor NusB [Flavobacteriaceae bacterium]